MIEKILMPALSPTMEEGNLAKWLVAEGDSVRTGDPIAEIETDKATMEVECLVDGTVKKILVAEGSNNVPVNSVLAEIATEEDEDVAVVSADTNNDNGATQPQPPAQPHLQPPLQPHLQPHLQPPALSAPAVSAAGRTSTQAATEPEVFADTTEITVRDALNQALSEELERDADVFVIGEEVAEYNGAYKITQGLLDRFGDKRVIDTPITEHGFTGLGVGAAMAGLRPVVEFMTFNFAMQGIDHIINSAAKTLYMSGGQITCPIVFRGPNGAASQVAAQHSQDFAAWYSQIPGLTVIAPYNAADAKGLLKSAIRNPNPIVFLENEILYGKKFPVPNGDEHLTPIGKARIERLGSDVTIVSWSIGMTYAIAAAEELAQQGIDAEIIDLRTIRPMDRASIVKSVEKTNRCVVVEEGWSQSGVAAEIISVLMEDAFDYLDAPVVRVTGVDCPMPYAKNLEKLALPSVEQVVQAAKAVLYR